MKKVFLGIATVAIVLMATSNLVISSRSMKMSDVALGNLEALAMGEDQGYDYEHGCITDCVDGPTGYKGVQFYCKPGSGGCLITSCISGYCG